MTNRFKIIIIGAMLATCIIGGVVVFSVSVRKSAQVRFFVAPSNAKISIGNTEYANSTLIPAIPGTSVATIEADGFQTKTINITLIDGETTHVHEYLVPEDNDYSAFESSYEDMYLLREYSSLYPEDAIIKNFLTDYDAKAKIKDILPLTSNEYYIFYEDELKDCDRLYCLEIGVVNKAAAEYALQDIRKHGFNPDDYQIIYRYD